MLARSLVVFSLAVASALFATAQIDAQPGKGPGKGSGGTDIKKLESDLERLLEQVKDAQSKLAKAREKGDGKGKKFEGRGKGKGFEGKGDWMKKGNFGKGKGDWMKKGGFGKGGEAKGKLDPETIKSKYEFYKKLYDELPKSKGKGFEGKGKGRGFEGKKKDGDNTPGRGPGGASIESRLDRLIQELEQLRREVRKK